MALRRKSRGEVSNAASRSAGATNSASASSGSIRIWRGERQESKTDPCNREEGRVGTGTRSSGLRAAQTPQRHQVLHHDRWDNSVWEAGCRPVPDTLPRPALVRSAVTSDFLSIPIEIILDTLRIILYLLKHGKVKRRCRAGCSRAEQSP